MALSPTSSRASSSSGELNYTQITGNVTVTATTEATATTIATAAAVTFDGATACYVEFFAPSVFNNGEVIFALYDGASSIGQIGDFISATAGNNSAWAVFLRRRLTPSAAAHTYGIRAYKVSGASTVTLIAGVGGSGADVPAFIRIVNA